MSSDEVTLMTEFWITLITWVFDSLMYRHCMCLEVTLLTEFWITLIACLVLDQVYFTVWLTVQAVSCFHSSAISYYKTVFLLVKRRNNAKKKKILFLKSFEVSSVAYAYTIQKLHSFYWVKLSLVCKGCRRLLSQSTNL